MPTVTVSDKGQVVIPAEIRRRLGIVPGCQLDFSLDGNAIRAGYLAGFLDLAHFLVEICNRSHEVLTLVVRAGNPILPFEDGDLNVLDR